MTSSLPRMRSTARAMAACWSGRSGSNRRHLPWQGNALPTELRPQFRKTLSYASTSGRGQHTEDRAVLHLLIRLLEDF